ncbi:hypothetical protein [Candidatus Enterococcus clewellii]|uniref:Uncharacterized protein n=1 Tax=Candidatus Enterococcus clewellii TaxID=1834193 RepID=A0A2C9XQT2_9ENTE|nr:hypothetical protein [Enterococcus sp. 9E7_DIV0242]OTP06712.1 hypothetical protein A5888_004213 [Enterococcus sp. 9E7_DIV0242]
MAYHTYEFLRKRRNEPKWRDAYLAARNKRIILFLVMGNLLFWGAIAWRYIENNDIDIMSYIEKMKQAITNVLE